MVEPKSTENNEASLETHREHDVDTFGSVYFQLQMYCLSVLDWLSKACTDVARPTVAVLGMLTRQPARGD